MINKKPENDKKVICYIASYRIRELDPFLAKNGFYPGMLLFSIPDYGIIYRCRVSGEFLEMEFAAFFALIQFVRTDLKGEKINGLEVISSMPEFIFSFTEHSPFMKKDSAHKKLLIELCRDITIGVKYVSIKENKALISAADYPSVPEPKKVKLAFNKKELSKTSFQQFQKGIRF